MTTTATLGPDWRQRAACRGLGHRVFYPEPSPMCNDLARSVCSTCPVRWECLSEANANGEQWGVWGGLAADERRGRA